MSADRIANCPPHIGRGLPSIWAMDRSGARLNLSFTIAIRVFTASPGSVYVSLLSHRFGTGLADPVGRVTYFKTGVTGPLSPGSSQCFGSGATLPTTY